MMRPAWLNILYMPTLFLLSMFIVYPFILGIRISLTNWDGFSQDYSWVGLENYARIFRNLNTIQVIRNTFIYGVGSTLLQNMAGLAYALLLNHKIRTVGFTRTIVYLPVMISPLIMGYIWYFVFQYHGGALNDIVLLFADKPFNFLAHTNVNVWLITFVNTFQFMGISMVIFLAGLQVIPKDYYEAANIDGASSLRKFRHITFPLLAPAMTVSIVLNLIGGLKLFDLIVSMTDSGPGYASASLSSLMYKLYFGRQDAGGAAALGVFMFIMISVVCLTALYALRRKEVDL